MAELPLAAPPRPPSSRKRASGTPSPYAKSSKKAKAQEVRYPESPQDVFHVFGRRIDLDAPVAVDAPLYSLLRAWVQDDPSRVAPGYTRPHIVPPSSLVDEELLALLLHALRPTRKYTPKQEILNSLPLVPPQTLLESHLAHFKLVRKTWKRLYALKYLQYRSRLMSLGVGICRVHEATLQEANSTVTSDRASASSHIQRHGRL